MSREKIQPFLINKDEDGNFRLTVRDVRYNSQGYPIVTSAMQDDLFKTATAARTYARDHFKAEAGQFATK
jgi:hypothetical protein